MQQHQQEQGQASGVEGSQAKPELRVPHGPAGDDGREERDQRRRGIHLPGEPHPLARHGHAIREQHEEQSERDDGSPPPPEETHRRPGVVEAKGGDHESGWEPGPPSRL